MVVCDSLECGIFTHAQLEAEFMLNFQTHTLWDLAILMDVARIKELRT